MGISIIFPLRTVDHLLTRQRSVSVSYVTLGLVPSIARGRPLTVGDSNLRYWYKKLLLWGLEPLVVLGRRPSQLNSSIMIILIIILVWGNVLWFLWTRPDLRIPLFCRLRTLVELEPGLGLYVGEHNGMVSNGTWSHRHGIKWMETDRYKKGKVIYGRSLHTS